MSKLTPIKAIRQRCINCSGFELKEVRECAFTDCPLFEYRSGHRPKQKAKRTPMKAIRAHCIGCCDNNVREVRLCTAEKCPLHPFRSGKRPSTINPSDDEEDVKKRELDCTFLPNKAMSGGDV